MTTVGLVLGAGGVAGGAWHAGCLAALAEAGWDARTADLIVGTSAGSGTAAAIRIGLDPTDLLASATGRPMSPAGRAYADRAGAPVEIPSPEVGGRVPTPQAPGLLLRSATPWNLKPFVALAAAVPEGRVSTSFIGDRVRRTHDAPWPTEPTWICAVHLGDGQRVVFGRDTTDHPDLATAVEASCAIPGFFAPVEIDGDRYVDGGAHSPTNADLVAGLGFDLMIVSSPMSATRAALLRPRFTGARSFHSMRLASEVARVRDSGTPALVLQPDASVVDTVGNNPMVMERRSAIADAAYASVRAHLSRPEIRERLVR